MRRKSYIHTFVNISCCISCGGPTIDMLMLIDQKVFIKDSICVSILHGKDFSSDVNGSI